MDMPSFKMMPVACPKCGESQNQMPGGFQPENDPFGPVTCIVCGHEFTRAEYMQGLAEVNAERRARANVIPFPSPD